MDWIIYKKIIYLKGWFKLNQIIYWILDRDEISVNDCTKQLEKWAEKQAEQYAETTEQGKRLTLQGRTLTIVLQILSYKIWNMHIDKLLTKNTKIHTQNSLPYQPVSVWWAFFWLDMISKHRRFIQKQYL